MTDQVRQFTVDAEDDGIRLDRWFKRHLPDASFNAVSRWARTGQIRVPPADPVTVAKTAAKPKKERPRLSDDQEAFADSLVIYRDKSALVLNKPPGLATQGGTKTTEHVDGLLDGLWFDGEQRPKLVHRLDKDTSGVLWWPAPHGRRRLSPKAFPAAPHAKSIGRSSLACRPLKTA